MNDTFATNLALLICPECHSEGPLTIEIKTRLTVYHPGQAINQPHHALPLSQENSCSCLICLFKGPISKFTTTDKGSIDAHSNTIDDPDTQVAPQQENSLIENDVTEDQIRKTARQLYASSSNDDIEIDDDATVNKGNEASWVQAWVWVHHSDIETLPEQYLTR